MPSGGGDGYQPGEMAEALPVSTFGLESMHESLSVVALKTNPKNIASALKDLKDLLLNQPRRPNVVEAGGETKEKLILLNPALVPCREQMPAECEQFAKAKGGEFVLHSVVTSYAHYSFEEVLKKLLPDGVEVPASFETIGHIAHLNLRPPHEPYRLLIARVMVDKYSAIKTVVHKTGNITNEFRVFSMEILADKQTGGRLPRMAEPCDPVLEATVKQSGCVFKLNFGDVYWNSRLEGEHARLVSTFKTGDVVWDLMGGIGPFAVPAARMQRCVVHANDLNPRSHHYLVENIRLNKVEKLVTPHCMCAREFVRHMVQLCGSALPIASGMPACFLACRLRFQQKTSLLRSCRRTMPPNLLRTLWRWQKRGRNCTAL